MFTDTPKENVRERVLAYGGPGVGKSTAILKLAQTLSVVDPKATVWVIDADDGLQKIWQSQFKSLTNLKWKHVLEWSDLQQVIPYLKEHVKENDWISIDMIGRFWEMAQSFEVTQVYGKTASEFMLVARAEAVQSAKMNRPATLPSVDWNIVKKLHNDDFIDYLTSDFPCNLFVTTSADQITDLDDNKTVAMFAATGFKPDGEKRNAYRFDTVMFLKMLRNGDRMFSTLKDRARPLIPEEKFNNLLGDYDQILKAKGFEGIFSTN